MAAALLAVANPAHAATSTNDPNSATGSLLPSSTSWPTPQIGMTLAYASNDAGAQASLLLTLNGGGNWLRLPPPPVRFPADHEQPQLVFRDGVIGVSDGSRIVTSQDSGSHWSAVHLSGVAGGADVTVSDLSIRQGRLLALVDQPKSAGTTMTLFSGSDSTTKIAPVRGVSMTGSTVYGDISTQGRLQIALGADYEHESYWYVRSGFSFTRAPLPCPATHVPSLGGIRQGRPVALCSESPSTTGPGSTLAQVYTAPRPGGSYTPAAKATQVPNPVGFSAASDRDVTLAGAPGLLGSFDAGASWTSTVKTGEGSQWESLAFLGPNVGVAVGNTVTQSLKPVSHVYRTTDAGHHWTALTLP